LFVVTQQRSRHR